MAERPRVLLVGPEEPLAACLDRMAAANIGSILVAEGDRVVGILTERDLLRRWRDLTHAPLMSAPIGTVATKPVFCMKVEQLASAPAEMIKRGIRHVPLVDDQDRLIGIMSMRDVLAAQLRAGTLPRLAPVSGAAPAAAAAVAPDHAARPRIENGTAHVLTPTAELTAICRRFLPAGWGLSVWSSIRSIENLPDLKDPEALRRTCFVLDLDGVAHQDWRALLRRFIKLLTSEAQPTIFLIWSPRQFSEKDVESLVAVASKARWRAFQRPLPVSALGEELAGVDEPQ